MAGNSTFTPGTGWTATPVPDARLVGPTALFIPVFAGQPTADSGSNVLFSVDLVGRKIYEKVGGVWNAGTTF